jgi:hypothetical protein
MLTLSIEELKEITGKRQKSKVKEWLEKQGINYLSEPDGWPKVSRELVQEALRGSLKARPVIAKKGNGDALREMQA